MQYIIFIFFSFASTVCVGQTKAELEKIAKFKRNYLKRAKLEKPDTLYLEKLMLVREKYQDYREIKTFEKNKDFVIGEQFYNRTNQIRRFTKYDTIGRPIGVENNYTRNGELQYLQNYDKGEWIVYHKESHPYYDLQNRAKSIADSLISKMYGNNFLYKHTLWIVDGSYISNENERQKRWTETLKEKPIRFSFCFKVRLDSLNNYHSYIYFDIDNDGKFLPNLEGGGFFFSGSGFENLPDSIKGSFKLNYNEALVKAKSLGLIETDSTKVFGQLFWENFRKLSIYNGQFRFYIGMKTKVIENLNPNGRSSKTTKYDVYSFSPWTGNFIEIKKMKQFQWWEKKRSGFSLLEPD